MPSEDLARRIRWSLLSLGLLSQACASEEAPPGTRPDRDPPRVVERYPEHRSVRPGFEGDVYIRFDEPLADPRGVERLLSGSPADRFVVRPGRSHVRIRPLDGWRPNAVYYLSIQPGVADLLRNRTTIGVDLIFSTGPDISDTRAAGNVYDRLRVQIVRDARLLFLGPDSVPYTAVSGEEGAFSLPSVPPGRYWAFGFRDENRNLALDRDLEPHDSTELWLDGPQSRSQLELWLVAPDTTPPLLLRAEPLDSLRVRLEFDDALDPEADLGQAVVRVGREDPRQDWPVATVAYEAPGVPSQPRPLDIGESDRSIEDAAGPDSTAESPGRDSLQEVGGRDSASAEVFDESVPDPTATPRNPLERARPTAFLSVELGRPLSPGSYRVTASGLVNLRGLSGGGDTTFVYAAQTDSLTEVAPDSTGAEP